MAGRGRGLGVELQSPIVDVRGRNTIKENKTKQTKQRKVESTEVV